MKNGKVIILCCVIFCSVRCLGQTAFYDAQYMRKESPKKEIVLTNNVQEVLVKYYPGKKSTDITATFLDANPFFKGLFIDNGANALGSGILDQQQKGFSLSSIAGLDVTKYANAIADIMIERAKQELTIAFFDRFKKFASDPKNPEFKILFPKTTENLSKLLTYKYPQMLPALRDGFFEDLKKITYHLDDLLMSKKYEKLLKNFPEIRVAIKSIRLFHEIETGASNAADVIKEFASFNEWSNGTNTKMKTVGSYLKIASLFSESIREDEIKSDGNRVWVSAKELKKLFYDNDDTLFNLYMGMVYQQSVKDGLKYIDTRGNVKNFSDLLQAQKGDIFVFKNKLKEFFDLAGNVNTAIKNFKEKVNPTNEDIYNYINTSLDVVDYCFGIARIFTEIPAADDYLKIARTSNDLYKNVYTKQYSQAVSNALDILTLLHDLTKAYDTASLDKKEKNKALTALSSFIKKVKPYALFMANMVEAKTEAEVKAALENVILPVGSSSIKKNSLCNISVQTYLGAYLSTSNGNSSSVGTWSDKFGVTAPIGISFTPGFLSWKKAGAVSLFGSLLDIGAIVDYKLKQDDPNGPVSKDYKIELGNIFSPGVYAVYGFPWNLPLSLGFGAQYGPGLSKIDGGGNTVIGNPSWRWNMFLSVDLTFFTLKNKVRDK